MAAMVATAAMAMEAMVATGVDTARGLLRLRLSLDTAMAATVMAVAMAVMAVMVATDVATTARGLLMPSPRLMLLLRPSPVMVMAVAMAVMAVMVATDMAVATTARGRLRLSLATAMAVMAV